MKCASDSEDTVANAVYVTELNYCLNYNTVKTR